MRNLTRILALGALLAWLPSCDRGDTTDHPGKRTYERYCFSCHAAGVADAPKFGDKDAWAPRLAKSRTELVDNVLRGMAPGMPPRAGCSTCTDEELADAVDFMVLRAQ